MTFLEWMLRSPVLPLLCFVSLVTSVSAECAWVLWDEHRYSHHTYKTAEGNVPGGRSSSKGDSSESLDIIGSYPTYAACQDSQEWKIGQILKRWRKDQAEEKPTFT